MKDVRASAAVTIPGSTQGGNCLNNAANGTGPQAKWAYYMNSGAGAVVTFPVLSGDGTEVAYIETSSGNHAILRHLEWKPGAERGQYNDLSPGVQPLLLVYEQWCYGCYLQWNHRHRMRPQVDTSRVAMTPQPNSIWYRNFH